MKVNEFIEGYLKSETKDKYVISHIKNNYISYLSKVSECNQIIKSTCYTNTEPKVFSRNRPNQNMLFVCRMIALYTDIELTFGDNLLVEEFDNLNKLGLIDMIVSNIYEKEYSEFEFIMDMCIEDVYDNERSMASIIDTIKVLFSTVLSSINIDDINNYIEKLSTKQ